MDVTDDTNTGHADAPRVEAKPETKAAPDRPRDPKRQALARRKLAITRQRLVRGPDQSNKAAKNVKYTPLEQQVVDLKKQNPGKVLLIEVCVSLSNGAHTPAHQLHAPPSVRMRCRKPQGFSLAETDVLHGKLGLISAIQW